MIRNGPSVMDSQEETLDIVKLKGLVLGLHQSEVSDSASLSNIIVPHVRLKYSQEELKNNIPNQPKLVPPSLGSGEALPAGRDLHSPPHPGSDATSSPRSTIDESNANETHISPASELEGSISVLVSDKMGSADTNAGDTQPISQSVFDSLIQRNISLYEGAQSSHTGNDDETTHMTLREGDSGHIDLLSGFGETVPLDEHSDLDVEQDRGSPSSPVVYQPNLFPESQRFVAKTPMTIEKQKSGPQMAATTPSLPRNPLMSNVGSSGGLMALSQVFQATQAPSSPFIKGLQSETMSDRPSPAIPIQTRPVGADIPSPFHSPVFLRRGFTEPHPHYISMKDSQIKRAKMKEERMTRSAENIQSEDPYDGDFDQEPSFLESRKLREKIDSEANMQLAFMTSGGKMSPLRQNRQSPTPASPARSERRRSVPASDRHSIDSDKETLASTAKLEMNGLSEEETEQEEDCIPPAVSYPRPQPSSEEDKENYGGPSVLVPNTTARAHGRLSQVLDIDQSPLIHRSTQGDGTEFLPTKPTRLNSRSPTRKSPRSSNTMYVRDSQTSPSQRSKQEGEGKADSPASSQPAAIPPGSLVQPGTQAVPSSELERICSSPLNRDQLPSSPPAEDDELLPDDAGSEVDMNKDFDDEGNSDHVDAHAPSASLQSQKPTVLSPHKRIFELRSDIHSKVTISTNKEQASSGSDGVAGTPAIRPRVSQEETVFETSIPETSPNPPLLNRHLRMISSGEHVIQEDDDLPPPRHMIKLNDAYDSQTNTPDKRTTSMRNSELILSSPSGRRRRALREIALEDSPLVDQATFDGVINVLTGDDREFARILNFHSSPPKKKRRGNDGEGFTQPPQPQSDPIPTTPRTVSSGQPIQMDRVIVTEPEEESPGPVLETEAPVRNRRGRPKRVDNLWELQPSPSKFSPAKRSPGRSRLAYSSGLKTTNLNRVSKTTLSRPVIIHHKRNDPQPEDRAESPDPLQADTVSVNVSPKRPPPVEKLTEGIPSSSHKYEEPESTLPVGVRCPNQVFAFWNDRIKSAYHAATCLRDTTGGRDRYIVRFEDSDPVEVPVGSVKRLELRPGDVVKVDMKNVPKIAHVVMGFASRLDPEELQPNGPYGEVPLTDVYGHLEVILQVKERKSLSAGGTQSSRRRITVPIKNVYLDKILWNSLQDRHFAFKTPQAQVPPRVRTPVDLTLLPTSPSSRISRNLAGPPGIFANMVFAVSYVEQEDAKMRVTELITENGGRILKRGFDELFNSPTVPTVTPLKGPSSQLCTPDSLDFRILEEAASVGFACLVADKHSRRAKYMQALALNIPCLSGRWVEDCVRQGQILPWENYLLPAGESAYLHGAIKSRNLTPNAAETAKFADTIAARPKLLDGQSVLLVMGKGKVEEKRKAYVFLTYALGASRVERVLDLKSAKAAILESQTGWDWVFVDDHEEAAAKAMLQRRNAGPIVKLVSRGSKKRKRSVLLGSLDSSDNEAIHPNVRVIDNEFVCQSLILGMVRER